jgi:hypothetical protein
VLALPPGADERAPGAAVTVAPCGHWEHEPPCPLAPHHVRAARAEDAAGPVFANDRHRRMRLAVVEAPVLSVVEEMRSARAQVARQACGSVAAKGSNMSTEIWAWHPLARRNSSHASC